MSRAAVPIVAVAATARTWDLMNCSKVFNKNFQAFQEHQVNIADAKPEKKKRTRDLINGGKGKHQDTLGIQNTALPKNRTREKQQNIMQEYETVEIAHTKKE